MTVVDWLIVATLVPAAIFFVQHSWTRWWKLPAGIAVWIMAAVVLAVLILASLRAFGVVLPDWVRGLVFVLINVALWGKVVALNVSRRRGDHLTPPSPDDRIGA